jgi:hypothetical protein
MNFLAKCFSTLALFIGGWRNLSHETVTELQQPCRKVAVIAHTSYWDCFWGIMYSIHYGIIHKVRFAMAPKVYDRFVRYPIIGNMIRKNCIRVTPKDETNGGSVQKIIDELNQLDDFIFMIAPAGTRTDNSEAKWRSGFIHICQGTQADLCVLGVDYSRYTHTCIMKEVTCEVDESLMGMDSQLRQLVSEYHSLNSIHEDVYNFDPVTSSTALPFLTSLTVFVMSCFGYLPFGNMFIAGLTAIAFGISMLHHSYGEEDWLLMDIHTKLMLTCHVCWMVSIYCYWSMTGTIFYFMQMFLLLCIYMFFMSGTYMVGWTEGKDGIMVFISRDDTFEDISVLYNLMVTGLCLCLTV